MVKITDADRIAAAIIAAALFVRSDKTGKADHRKLEEFFEMGLHTITAGVRDFEKKERDFHQS